MQKKGIAPKRTIRILRIVLKTILFIFLFVVFLFILLLTPPVQKFLTARVQHYLENKLQTKVRIGRISFSLAGRVSLHDVYIEDQKKDTLLIGDLISGRLNFLRLFSNEVQIKNVELNDITAKIKRVLPDTVYNFQFIADAFVTESSKLPDTAQTPPMKLDVNKVSLSNVNFYYTDVITGSGMSAHIGEFTGKINKLDPYSLQFDFPSLALKDSRATIKQNKPLVEPKPLEEHVAKAVTPSPVLLNFGSVDLNNVKVDYANDVSTIYTIADIGELKANERSLDLQNFAIDLKDLVLNNSNIAIRLGKTQQAEIVKQEMNKEVEAQKQAAWDIQIENISLKNNTLKYDDDNSPVQKQGIDYAHLSANDLSLSADNFILTPDSVAAEISDGAVNEKSGLVVEKLQGDILYTSNQTSLHNLFIKTPGTELKKDIELNYPSFEAFTKNLDEVSAEVKLVSSKVQVKDILLFAPQLRSQLAFRDPNDTWNVNIVGAGTVNQFNFETLQFNGLSNTQINAHGSLSGLNDPKNAGGNFVIDRIHTNQNDIAVFTGQKLSNQQMNLPQEISAHGTIKGNAGVLNTNLTVSTSEGSAVIDGKFGNFNDLSNTFYDGVITTNNLQLGNILMQPEMIGSLTGTIKVNGKGLTTGSVNTKFSADIQSMGLNQYQYKNINATGSLVKTNFDVKADINDPNVDANFIASGNFSDNPSFSFNGMIDSIKTLPLHFTTEPLIARAKINGNVSDINADNINANILITQSLFVTAEDRLSLDTIQLESGRTDTANYIRLRSDIANASITGHYRIAELGDIVLNSVQPYFNTGVATQQTTTQPYDFNFAADITYHPIFSAFVPGLTAMKTLHVSGSFSANGQMNAVVTTPYVVYMGNTMTDVKAVANTSLDGLHMSGNIAHLISGSTYNVYNLRLNAVAVNNNIDFSLGIDDKSSRNKYFVAGLLTQPTTGTYNIQLKSDSLLLNYQRWTVSANNRIVISPTNIAATDFVLQNGNQRLSINSPNPQQELLQIGFSNFQLATITGFIKADSILADGVMNGNISLGNYLKQPNFTGDLTINNMSFQHDTIGNVVMHATTAGNNRYNIETNITGQGNDVVLTGSFTTLEKDIDLDLVLNVRTLQLHSIEGAMGGAIKNATGAVNGNVTIRGKVTNPVIRGDLNFDNSSFAISSLGSQYFINNQKLSVSDNGFAFNKFVIKDSASNTLLLDGNIVTNNFTDYFIDLRVTSRNFELLNSTKKDNDIYYGRLNITSDFFITGPPVKPFVDGDITVNDGTALTFVVPQPEPGVASREGIVEFIDMSNPAADTMFRKYDSLNTTNALGMDIAVNIEIKKEAIFNIVVDAANGDFINVQGEALLSTGVDPSGKITMTGNYTLDKGYYELSFNFLKRKFEIQKGSTITWIGEPTAAKLDVSAVYIANTAPIDLVKNQIEASAAAIRNTYMQKLPFELHLNLTGELMKPVVDFDIVLPENKNYGVANDVVTTVQFRLDQLRQDKGETNKQVFSLLLLNRFVGENPLQSESGGFNAASYARQSASKLLTEQLNQLAAGLINGVDINFDVTSTEDYTTGSMRNRTDLNLAVSKQLLNDRLRVSVGSNFELEGPQHTNQQNTNIAGNVAIDYQLSKDGKYMLRYFRKNDYEGEIDGYVIENGLSFIITVDYDRFSELLRRRRKQKVEMADNAEKSIAQ